MPVSAKTASEEFNEVHLSFALGELGLSMNEFFDMPWCEYLIKCYGWRRMQIEDWKKVRLIAYESRVGPHINPKNLPKSIEQYLPLESKRISKKSFNDELQKIRNERKLIKNRKK